MPRRPALVTVVAQREAATGGMSALNETIETVVGILSVLAGGWMASHFTPRTTFLLVAGLTLPIFLQAFWSPAAVFPKNLPVEEDQESESLRELFRRLIPEGKKLQLVAIILMLYNFSPGWGTPLFYYLTNTVHLSSEAFGVCRAVQYGGVLVASVVYGAVSRRLTLRQVLQLAITMYLSRISVSPDPRNLGSHCRVGGSWIGFGLRDRGCVRSANAILPARTGGVPARHWGTQRSRALAGAFGDVLGATVYALGDLSCAYRGRRGAALILPLLRRLPGSDVSHR